MLWVWHFALPHIWKLSLFLSLLPWIVEYIVLYHHLPWGFFFCFLFFSGLYIKWSHRPPFPFPFCSVKQFLGLEFHSTQTALVMGKEHPSVEILYCGPVVNLSSSRSTASEKHRSVREHFSLMYLAFHLCFSRPLIVTISQVEKSWSGMKICSLFCFLVFFFCPSWEPKNCLHSVQMKILRFSGLVKQWKNQGRQTFIYFFHQWLSIEPWHPTFLKFSS